MWFKMWLYLYILEENKKKLLDTLFVLKKNGFIVGRYDNKLLSIVRNNEYIDFYFFRKKNKNVRECDGYIISNVHFEGQTVYSFLGQDFYIPGEEKLLLVKLYGKDWAIPKKNTPASNHSTYLKFKFLIKNNSTILFTVLSKVKSWI